MTQHDPNGARQDESGLTYGAGIVTIDGVALPDESMRYLLDRGFAHVMGNQASSKVTSAREAALKAAIKAGGVEDEAEWISDWNDANAADVLADARADFLTRLLDGTMGTGATGPRLRGIDKVMRDVATEQVKAAAGRKKMKLPKGEALATLIDNHLAKAGAAIRAEAQRRMDAVETTVDLDSITG